MKPTSNMLRRIGWNAISVLGGDVFNKASTFLVYAILARHAGTHQFGQLALGLMLLYTFHVFAAAGLPTSLTREVAKRRSAARRFLWHGYLAGSLPAMLAIAAMALFGVLMRYEQDTATVIALLSLSIVPYAMTMITEAAIKGIERMHLIALGNVPGNVLLVAASYYFLTAGYGVLAIAAVVITARTLTWLTMLLLFVWNAPYDSRRRQRSKTIRPVLSWILLKRSMLFLGTDSIGAIWASLNGVMLSKFASESELGLLGASFQLLQPVLMFYRSVGHGSFPALVSSAKTSRDAVGGLSRSLVGVLLKLAFPACLATWFLAGDALELVYGNPAFRSGAIVLQILAFTLLLDPMNPVLGHGLWAMGFEKTVFRIVVVNLLINTVVGFILIGQFGLIGAACSVLLASVVNAAQHYWYFERNVSQLRISSELLRILPAALIAVVIMMYLPAHHFVSLPLAIAVYLLLAFVRLGGWLMPKASSS